MNATRAPSQVLKLQAELNRITSELAGEEGILAIEGLRSTHPHDIQLVQRRDVTQDFTCYQYALGLQDIPDEIDLLRINHRLILGEDFVQHLIENRLSRVTAQDAGQGDIVVYAEKTITHAGRVDGDRIVSKWGTGHLWRHSREEVPSRYGSVVGYFKALQRVEALNSFVSFARVRLGDGVVDSYV